MATNVISVGPIKQSLLRMKARQAFAPIIRQEIRAYGEPVQESQVEKANGLGATFAHPRLAEALGMCPNCAHPMVINQDKVLYCNACGFNKADGAATTTEGVSTETDLNYKGIEGSRRRRPRLRTTPGKLTDASTSAMTGVRITVKAAFTEMAAKTEKIIRERMVKVEKVAADDLTNDVMRELKPYFDQLPKDINLHLQEAAMAGVQLALQDIQSVMSIDITAGPTALTPPAGATVATPTVAVPPLSTTAAMAIDHTIIGQSNEAARVWSNNRAAEMVGMRWENGVLVPNSNAKWQITDTTRNMLRDIFEDVFAQEVSPMNEIIDRVQSSGAFSDARAAMIAKTEVSRAQTQGVFAAWMKTGLVQSYNFLVSGVNPCERCLSIAAGTSEWGKPPFKFTDGPLPIDDTHPNCMCDIVAAELIDPMDALMSDATEKVAKGDVEGHEFHGNRYTGGGGIGRPMGTSASVSDILENKGNYWIQSDGSAIRISNTHAESVQHLMTEGTNATRLGSRARVVAQVASKNQLVRLSVTNHSIDVQTFTTLTDPQKITLRQINFKARVDRSMNFETPTTAGVGWDSILKLSKGESGWIGVDLDGTLAVHEAGDNVDEIGAPIPAMVDRVIEWLKEGKDVRIFTARVSDDPEGIQEGLISEWCMLQFGEYLPITCVKDRYMIELWDDRARHVERNTGIEKVKKPVCPHCGSSDYALMPTDFETAKCNDCGRNWDHGIIAGINNPSEKIEKVLERALLTVLAELRKEEVADVPGIQYTDAPGVIADSKEFSGIGYRYETKEAGTEQDVAFYSRSREYAEEHAKDHDGQPSDVEAVEIEFANAMVVRLSQREFSDPIAEHKYIVQARIDGNDGVIFRTGNEEFYVTLEPRIVKGGAGSGNYGHGGIEGHQGGSSSEGGASQLTWGKRDRDSGEYTIRYKDRNYTVYRDPESSTWRSAELVNAGGGSPVDFLGFSKQEVEERIKSGKYAHTLDTYLTSKKVLKGGEGSGNFGHAGVPGEVGGSAPMSRTGGGIGASYNEDTKTWTNEHGEPLPEHMKSTYIPPGWKNVRYNDDPNGALKAVGEDSKGRMQAVYDRQFVKDNADAKFARIQELDQNYDKAQQQVKRDILAGTNKEEASCLHLVMTTGVRPGSDAETGGDVKAYGATTLQGKHVVGKSVETVRLKFIGKKGVKIDIPVTDAAVAKDLLKRKAAAGANGRLFATDGSKLRAYTHTVAGEGFKTKDFRTLLGTRTAMAEIEKMPVPKTLKAYKASVLSVGKAVSAKLGNTPAVALSSYVNPVVFSGWRL